MGADRCGIIVTLDHAHHASSCVLSHFVTHRCLKLDYCSDLSSVERMWCAKVPSHGYFSSSRGEAFLAKSASATGSAAAQQKIKCDVKILELNLPFWPFFLALSASSTIDWDDWCVQEKDLLISVKVVFVLYWNCNLWNLMGAKIWYEKLNCLKMGCKFQLLHLRVSEAPQAQKIT